MEYSMAHNERITDKYLERNGQGARIVGNENYPPKEGNAFLMIQDYSSESCLGSVDKWTDRNGKEFWEASVSVPYDEKTDSDSMVLESDGTRESAIDALWDARVDILGY